MADMFVESFSGKVDEGLAENVNGRLRWMRDCDGVVESSSCWEAAPRVTAMISDQRFYARRAAEELSRAGRALTPEARDWHLKLARAFTARAQGHKQSFLEPTDGS